MADVRTLETRRPSYVGWGAVFSGALVGIATMTLLSALWIAVGGEGSNWASDNVRWLLGGSAIFALFTASLIAGWFAGARGAFAGVVHGATVWGLFVLLATFVTPGVMGAIGFTPDVTVDQTGVADASGALWTVFWSLLAGLGTSLLGGVAGGLLPRPSHDMQIVEERERRAA